MKIELVAVIADQKILVSIESDNKDQCCLLRRTLCTALANQVDTLTLIEVKEG